jgi:hypothetical protein
MKSLLLSALFVFIVLNQIAFAGEKVVSYNVFNNTEEININDEIQGIVDIDILKVPTKIKYIESDSCQFDDSPSCNRVEILEEVKVIQVKVQYKNGSWRSEDDDVTKSLEFNFPVNSVSHEDLLMISENSRGLDFTGKKARARTRMANKLFELNREVAPKIISVIDYDKSKICDAEDVYCEEEIILKKIKINVQNIKINLKK